MVGKYPGYQHVSLDKIRKYSSSRLHRMLENHPEYENIRLSSNRKIEDILIRKALSAGKSIIIDNTNLIKKVRVYYVELAREYNIKISGIVFTNLARAYLQNENRTRCLESWILDNQQDVFEYPDLSEGFEYIEIIP